jgi:FlaA1/EpsC-like NDP-sugar epimerase
VLFDLSEYALYRIEQEFHDAFATVPIAAIVGDVRNGARLKDILLTYRPEIVFHAAAYKHVPLMEEENAWEAASNNALGTYVIASAAKNFGVKRFVLISTDKAVNPTNIMGATKRLAEMICGVLQIGSKTRFVVVRFGNVLGSTGSVIPKFREQIARGGPVTVTHPEITRYFMSIPEASQLVLQSCHMGQGGEIFVLDMGGPVKIVDLAKELIRLSGFSEDDVPIHFTGLRPGEKLYEELLAEGEDSLLTSHAKLRVARTRVVSPTFLDEFLAWVSHTPENANAVRHRLRNWIPEYRPAVIGVRKLEEDQTVPPVAASEA